MRLRTALGVALVASWVWVACSSSDDGGSSTPSKDAGTDASSFGSSACFTCIGTTCEAALSTCSNDPGCGAYLGCVKGCGTAANGAVLPDCEAQCQASAAASQALDDAHACIVSGSGCAECGAATEDAGSDAAVEADTPNPALTQTCTQTTDDDKCVECALNHCCDSADAILGDGEAGKLADCMGTCDDPLTADDCEYACVQAHPDGAEGYGGWFACYGHHCSATAICDSSEPCSDCLFTTCAEKLADCYTDSDCLLLFKCTVACETGECGVACLSQYAAGQKLFGDYFECTKTCPC